MFFAVSSESILFPFVSIRSFLYAEFFIDQKDCVLFFKILIVQNLEMTNNSCFESVSKLFPLKDDPSLIPETFSKFTACRLTYMFLLRCSRTDRDLVFRNFRWNNQAFE